MGVHVYGCMGVRVYGCMGVVYVCMGVMYVCMGVRVGRSMAMQDGRVDQWGWRMRVGGPIMGMQDGRGRTS